MDAICKLGLKNHEHVRKVTSDTTMPQHKSFSHDTFQQLLVRWVAVDDQVCHPLFICVHPQCFDAMLMMNA